MKTSLEPELKFRCLSISDGNQAEKRLAWLILIKYVDYLSGDKLTGNSFLSERSVRKCFEWAWGPEMPPVLFIPPPLACCLASIERIMELIIDVENPCNVSWPNNNCIGGTINRDLGSERTKERFTKDATCAFTNHISLKECLMVNHDLTHRPEQVSTLMVFLTYEFPPCTNNSNVILSTVTKGNRFAQQIVLR